jgi:hypothetical protein
MFGDFCGVAGVIFESVRNEKDSRNRAVEAQDVRGAVIKKGGASGCEGAADQEQIDFGAHRLAKSV